MFTDIVGYTALMSKDEDRALQLLQKNRALLKPIIEQFHGEWLKEMGDGTLSSFASAVEAVNCAIEIQHILQADPDLSLRIGIHIGDVVFEQGDVFGEGVNVASRIEPLAEPGCVCISERVYEDIRNKPGIEGRFLGEKKLKGMDHPVQVYTVTEIRAPLADRARTAIQPLGRRWWTWTGVAALVAMIAVATWWIGFGGEAIPEAPLGPKSVAVLPFDNLSDSKEDEYFSDGVTDDIITHLTKIGDLKVISRTSAILYKDSPKTLRIIADELGVSNILEGTVRRAGGQVRITGQLIDARTDEHLWAETYDRDLIDIFAIQSDVAQEIAAALKIVLQPEVKERIERIPTQNLEAYEYYLQALDYLNRSVNEKTVKIAIDLLDKAVNEDPTFIEAYAVLVEYHLHLYWFGFATLEEREPLAKQALERVEAIDPEHPAAYYARGYYYHQALREGKRALEEFTRAHHMEPGNVQYLHPLGSIQISLGLVDEGLANLERCQELDPRSSVGFHMLGRYYVNLKQITKSIRYLDRAIELAPDVAGPYSDRAWTEYHLTGNTNGARQILAEGSTLVDPSAFVIDIVRFNIRDGQYSEALEQLQEVDEDAFFWSYFGYQTRDALEGLILENMGRSVDAKEHFEEARKAMETRVEKSPGQAPYMSELGLMYAHLGMKDKAIQEGLKAIELRPLSMTIWATIYLGKMARIYTVLGEKELAIDYLFKSAKIPSGIYGGFLKYGFWWNPLRDHPRFRLLLSENP
jgi:TolB-like protein